MSDGPPAGWYPLANDPARERYWDGAAWTDERSKQPTQPGWYPDDVTGERRYWTGTRWGAPAETDPEPDDKITGAGVALSVFIPIAGVIYAVVQLAKGRVRAGTSALVISIVVGAIAYFVITAIDGSSGSVSANDIEADLGPELERGLGNDYGPITVSSVKCVSDSEHHATCLADISDDTGDQTLSVDVTFDQDKGSYIWQVR
jgi:hypothetical protein